MELLDGALVSAHIKAQIKSEAAGWLAEGNTKPHLAAILVGNEPASEAYVNSKVKTCDELNFRSTLLRYSDHISQDALVEEIRRLNQDNTVDGILVQLPLPAHIAAGIIINTINPDKDVDGFHPISLGRMLTGEPTFLPATPFGILMLLDYYKIHTDGRHVVIVGRSNIVGTPLSILLSRNAPSGNATVTLCHSRTRNLKEICVTADILVAAIGRPRFVTADMVREGAIVIDVGINRVADVSRKSGYRLVGDVDFDHVAPRSSYITPVPRGVGLMIICGLMKNTFTAAKQHAYITDTQYP